MQLFLKYFSEGLPTSNNLCHSDLFRMERSRITQSHPVITWSTHATHSWFQYRVSREERQREAKSSYCTIAAQAQGWSCSPPKCDKPAQTLKLNSERAIIREQTLHSWMTAWWLCRAHICGWPQTNDPHCHMPDTTQRCHTSAMCCWNVVDFVVFKASIHIY